MSYLSPDFANVFFTSVWPTLSSNFFMFIVAIILSFLSCSLLLYIGVAQLSTRKQLEYMAFIDALTGAPNWNRFTLDAATNLAKDKSSPFVILQFDINNFRVINDMYGYESGNQILKSIATILSHTIVEEELFARVSADNFVLLLHYTSDTALLHRLHEVTTSICRENKAYNPTLAFGIYRIERDTEDIPVLYDRATIAKRTIKSQTTSGYAFFTPSQRETMLCHKRIQDSMKQALENEEFVPYLQPKYNIFTKQLVGAEALVRWIPSDGKIIPPNAFIPVFEHTGFIVEMDLYMFKKACALIHDWLAMGLPVFPIAINLSRAHFYHQNLLERLCEITSFYDVPTHYIELEITETVFLEDKKNLIFTINELRKKGFRLAIDDFGSGYSSLNVLRELPFDVLKLDQEFFGECSDVAKSNIILKSIIQMAQSIAIEVVAEGIETPDQVDLLQHMGCHIAQGYYFAKPMTIEEFEAVAFAPTQKNTY